MENQQGKKTLNPKHMLIQVMEQGVLKVNVRLPFFLVKMGLKFGRMAANANHTGSGDKALEYLKDVDLDAVLQSLDNGELSLPLLLVDVDEPENNTHVTLLLE